MKHWFHPEARAEFLGSVRYYELQQPGLGRRFLETVTETIRRIQDHPNLIILNLRKCAHTGNKPSLSWTA